jgi:penicillin-binding protein 1A
MALKDIPIMERPVPNGIIQAEGDYFYVENPPGSAIRNLSTEEVITE